MYRSVIRWYEGEREVTHETLSAHLAWLTMLWDATGQRPETIAPNGETLAVTYDSRGNARLKGA